MKKIFSFGAIAAAVMAFAGCAQEIEQPEVPQQEGVAYELVAEVSTKTVNDGMSTKWEEGDALNVFFTEAGSESYGSNNQFTIADPETGLFTGTLTTYPDPTKNYDWYVIYPYNTYVTTPASKNSGYLTLAEKEQRQTGVDNMSHIEGKNYPLYGKLLNNPGNVAPALELTHAAALLRVVVKNTTSEPMVVTDIFFTAPEDVVGTYYFNITGDNAVYTGSGPDYVSATAALKVSDAEVPAGGEAAFYMAIKPFTAAAEAELSLAVNDKTAAKTVKLAESKTFEAGVITTLNFTVEETVEPNLPVVATVKEFLDAAEDDTEYILTGVITSVANTQYGNFDLTDETGTVYIYGLCSPEGEQKYWAASGAKLGDTITVKTKRTSYNNTPQGKNAIFMELVPFSQPSEWGVVGDLTSWGQSKDIPLYTIYGSPDLFVAYNVEIASGAIKVRANNAWNDAKNYGLEVEGKIEADKYYTALNGAGSQNATPRVYGTYDVYFDLANERLALMTPGKSYSEAVDGGEPIVVVEGLADHTWGVIGSFEASADWTVEVAMEVDGDWAVAKNVTLATNNEFKFRADNAWTLSYGSACDVNVGETYTTYNNGGNMKFVGEAGAYNIYFSLVTAKFYMEPYVEGGAEPETVTLVASDFNFTEGVKGTVAGELAYKLGTSSKTQTLKIKANGYKTITFNAAGWTSGTNTMTITNGIIDGATTVTLVNDSQINSTNISNSNVNVPSLSGSVHTYTIEVTDGNSEVSITAKRAAVWGFTATK